MHADFYLLLQLMFCILNSMDITLCEASVGQRGKGGICVLGNKRGPIENILESKPYCVESSELMYTSVCTVWLLFGCVDCIKW